MKKFLIDTIAILLIAVLLLIGINAAYVSLDNEETEIDKFTDIRSGIKVCNVGSSHGKNSLIYDDWQEEINCFNFGLTAQRFQYDYRLIEYYSDYIDEGAVVLIPFSYFSLWGPIDVENDEFKSMNNRYYNILPPKYIIDYELWVDVCQHYIPVLSAYDKVIDAFKDAVVGEGTNEAFYDTSIDLYEDAKESYVSQIAANKDAEGNSMLNLEREAALYDLIGYCKEQGYHPVLITTPFTDIYVEYVQKIDLDFVDIFYEKIDEIAKKAQIEYYDYSADSRLCHEHEYYIDAHHLNPEGGKIFTDIVIKEVVSKYIDDIFLND